MPHKPPPPRKQKLSTVDSTATNRKRSKGQTLKTNIASKQLQCRYCRKMYQTKKRMDRHLANKHEITETHCASCKKYLKDRRGLHTHLTKTHSRKQVTKCKHCGNVFRCVNAQRSPRSHQAIQENIYVLHLFRWISKTFGSENSHWCKTCNKNKTN